MFTRTNTVVALTFLAQFFALPLPSRASGEMPSELKGVCLYHPEPAWWSLARRGMHGKVVCQLQIDPKNGEVSEVKVLLKTHFEQLNAACVMACFQWKFKPGTVTQVKVPFVLELKGYFKEIH